MRERTNSQISSWRHDGSKARLNDSLKGRINKNMIISMNEQTDKLTDKERMDSGHTDQLVNERMSN